jgi:lysophospholipase L1-like esterase
MRVSAARRLKDAVVLLLVTALLLIALETAAHFLMVRESGDALHAQGADATSRTLAWLDRNLVPLNRDVDFLWRNRASIEKRQPVNPQRFGRRDEWTLVHNARGFRSIGPTLSDKTADEFRILCIGDSVTYGFNVDQTDSYPERLQAALRARYPGRPITVINAGSPGWSWVQGMRFLEREGIGLHPDLVIMALGTNDRFFRARMTDAERLEHLSRPGVRWVESFHLLLGRTATYRLVERWFARPIDGADGMSAACRRQMATQARRCSRVGLEEIETSIVTADRVVTDAGAGLLVLNLDFQQTDAVTAVRNAVRRARIPFVDVVSEYLSRRARNERAREHRLGLAAALMPTPAPLRKHGPAHVLFRVLVSPGALSVRVDGDMLLGPTTFRVALSDDGHGGDEIAADGVWSGRVEGIPLDEGPLLYSFVRDDVPELLGLPPFPSTQGRRKRRVAGDAILPVEVFGDMYLMAETTHPNAAGHELIAASVLASLRKLPGFARWSALHDARPAQASSMSGS